jgi:acyl-CoA synthetase (NDP forming)/RimJ/RimL family protein N-acetyltransferase
VTEHNEVPSYDDSEAPEPPAHWEADVVVADGGSVHLRPIRPSDAPALVAFHTTLSERTRYLRFFSPYPRIPARDLYRFTHVDHAGRVALIAELGGQIIAVGRYERIDDTDEAEVAFVVSDAHQGRGIGSVLLEHLAAAAREVGLKRFQALVLAENGGMLRVFRDAGYEISRHFEHGEVSLEFDVAETDTTAAVMREREQSAEARSIQRLLVPRSVAVIGASADPHKIGNAVFGNLLHADFAGVIYPVNPTGEPVRGVASYRDVTDIPGGVDLAVILTPADAVPDVVARCGDVGVRGLIVISAGFGERGSEVERSRGLALQREVLHAARADGVRMVGPNCLGVVNTDPDVRLNASLAPTMPPLGRAGFFCQSGALGIAVLAEAARRGLGVSTFVSAGNRADVSGNDLLQFWETDPATDLALLYLESFGNPRKFVRVARRLGRSKPIVVVRGAVQSVVVPGLQSTTVQLAEATVRALFEASGVIRVDTLDDLFDVGLLLASQPLPPGSRVGVVGNSAALAMLVANACRLEDLVIVRDDDVGPGASAQEFAAALDDVYADDAVDAVIVVFVPPLMLRGVDEYAAAVRHRAATGDKPVVSTFLGFDGVPAGLAATGSSSPPPGSVVSYRSPERAVRALARVVRYAAWRRRPEGELPLLDGVDLAAAHDLVTAVLAAEPGGRDLAPAEVDALLGCLGVPVTTDHPVEVVEVVVRVQDDPSLGGLISFGVGGVATELLGDLGYATTPLTADAAADLVDTPRASPLLRGYGGATPCDRTSLVDLVLRLAALGDAVPEVCDLRVTGLAAPVGVYVTAATAQVRPAASRLDTGPRRLTGL